MKEHQGSSHAYAESKRTACKHMPYHWEISGKFGLGGEDEHNEDSLIVGDVTFAILKCVLYNNINS